MFTVVVLGVSFDLRIGKRAVIYLMVHGASSIKKQHTSKLPLHTRQRVAAAVGEAINADSVSCKESSSIDCPTLLQIRLWTISQSLVCHELANGTQRPETHPPYYSSSEQFCSETDRSLQIAVDDSSDCLLQTTVVYRRTKQR